MLLPRRNSVIYPPVIYGLPRKKRSIFILHDYRLKGKRHSSASSPWRFMLPRLTALPSRFLLRSTRIIHHAAATTLTAADIADTYYVADKKAKGEVSGKRFPSNEG